MTKAQQTPGPAAWETNRDFYRDAANVAAAEMMRQALGGRGLPGHDEIDAYVRPERPARRVAATSPRRPVARQARQAINGRPVRPLPTRTARRTKAKARKVQRRLGLAAPVAMIVMIILLFLIPPVAAVTMGLAVGWLVLAQMK